jgi:hypothetical protein
MPVHEVELRQWLHVRMEKARAKGARVSLRSLAVKVRPTDPNWLTEWDRGIRKSPPSLDEWVVICRTLRELGVQAPLTEVLVFYGVDKGELAAELEALAPYSDPATGSRLAGRIRQLTSSDLEELEDFIGWLKYSSGRRSRGRSTRRTPRRATWAERGRADTHGTRSASRVGGTDHALGGQ